VWTHEFAHLDNLVREFLGESQTPTIDEIMAMLPEEKTIFVTSGEQPK
jgi:hypothetical protein